ncbi:hypothetical protein [Mesorhizobium retamae]|uniref:Uncharacterized protein n=1 Tax=Mesorhizobium retamae TaxID=2912854 RepID=A0ABS9QBB5_9HYPH|nr:hypothetical protein [Mesorhizobium sp. IRAMC:0171]MCG7504712.1 hypothetical protein [Mesorhizobium sp. IRAMC:0171]
MVTKLRDKTASGLGDQKPIDGPSFGLVMALVFIIAISMFGIAYLAISIV